MALTLIASLGHSQSVSRLELPTPGERDQVAFQLLRQRGEKAQTVVLPGGGEAGWLFLREEGRAENLDRFPTGPKDRRVLALPRHDAHAALLGMDTPSRLESIPAGELESFLLEKAGCSPADTKALGRSPARTVTIRRLESLAALIPGQGAAQPSAVVTAKRGQRMELRPLIDPLATRPPSDLPFRLYLPPEADAARLDVQARRLEDGTRVAVRLADDHSGSFKLIGPGTWLLEAHLAEADHDEAEVVWKITSSTLVLAVGEWVDDSKTEEESR